MTTTTSSIDDPIVHPRPSGNTAVRTHGQPGSAHAVWRRHPDNLPSKSVILPPPRVAATSYLGRSVIQVPVGPPYVISRFSFGLFPSVSPLSLLLSLFLSSPLSIVRHSLVPWLPLSALSLYLRGSIGLPALPPETLSSPRRLPGINLRLPP